MTTVAQLINAETQARKDADTALAARIAKLEAVTPTPPASLPAGSVVINPTDSIRNALAAGARLLYLRTGTHSFALGSAPTTYRDVSILAYPGDTPVIDGTGLDPHLVYLDSASGTWTLGVKVQGFWPIDSGVIGVGNDCHLETVEGFAIVGHGAGGVYPTTSGPQNSHGIYAHGTGTYHLTKPSISNVPGGAITHYRGTPVGVIDGGSIGSLYESALIYSGSLTANGLAFTEPKAAWDIQVGGDSTGSGTATLTGCTGTGPGGTVRRMG